MKVHLLYADREWNTMGMYSDSKNIIQDLGLKTLFSAAGKEVVTDRGKVICIGKEDKYLSDTMKKVMMVPLTDRREIAYRQEVLRDALECPQVFEDLFAVSAHVLEEWNKLGRKEKKKSGHLKAELLNEIRVGKLFVKGISAVQKVLLESDGQLKSRGFAQFGRDLEEAYPAVREEAVQKVLKDVSFYEEEANLSGYLPKQMKPRIVFTCGISGGLKLGDLSMEELSSQAKTFYNHGGTFAKIQDYIHSLIPNSVQVTQNETLTDYAGAFEYSAVQYAISSMSPFYEEFQTFFDQLRFQCAFYLGAVHLGQHFRRFRLEWCFPTVGEQYRLQFTDLKEPVMCMEQRIDAVGNDNVLTDKRLLIVTGANQGGKSTYLRSIGIAQILMQSGLMVPAKQFCSSIYDGIYTHFTRREDSAMNCGRLDEELRRMSQIIDRVSLRSLVLLNESFASTTEKEGSAIAYDITKALSEAGVTVMTVTHLLSFAKQVYTENRTDVAFLSAQRLADGRRTFKMIPHEPELTSFGLDLYEEIIGASDGAAQT